jgi:nitrite reductase (cytochrome c-552)
MRNKGLIAAAGLLAGGLMLLAGVGEGISSDGPKHLARTQQPSPQAPQQGAERVDADQCFGCHSEVRDLFRDSAHADLGCATCHAQMEAHLRDPKSRVRTSTDPEVCGQCHTDQYESSMQVNWAAEPRMEKGVPTGRSPLQDKLLAPHGFTVEHNEPRAHPFMVVDQLVVDRFAGGRYQYRDPWGVVRPGKVWDVLEDTGEVHPGLVAAGNAVCLQCKTSDLILDWAYMGDPGKGAKWDRTSDVNELVRDVHNAVGCIHCHDPHGTMPRVVRDALIEGIERGGATPYREDKGMDAIEVIDFRDFRKIGLVKEPRSNLLCGQCHVEYACNPGIAPEGDERVTMESRLSNHFPMKNVLDVLDHFTEVGFRDFTHAVTGARLIKLQHPEMESYWESPHERAGVKCADCHMGRSTNGAGETFTNHQMLRPAHHIDTICMGCHPDATENELRHQIAAVQNYTRGKLRNAEQNLEALIDTYALAAREGVSEEVLAQARKQHEIAHALWEWWTAENSDGWHNAELARQSLLDSISASRRGVDILQTAMKPQPASPVIR